MLFDCNDLVLKHFDKPTHVGKLNTSKSSVVNVRMGEQYLGEILDLYLDINPKQKITDIKFQVLGNPFLIAGASWLAEKLNKKSLSDAEKINYKQIMDTLQFPTTKQATAVMLETTLKQALFLWRQKHGNEL